MSIRSLIERLTKSSRSSRSSSGQDPWTLPPNPVFIAYGGEVAKAVGIAMCSCLESHGFNPLIQARRTQWWIGVTRQEEVFRIERQCIAVLAVNTDESYDLPDRVRFSDEVEKAKYITPVPLVGFIQEDGRVLENLSVGCDTVLFQRDHHSDKCEEVVDALNRQISRGKDAQRTSENADLMPEVIQ